MKKLWMVLISLTTLMILLGCDSSNEHVPLILYDDTDPYILEFRDHILQNSSDDIIIDVYDAQRSQLIQNEIIGELLLEEPSLMVINPVDRLGVYTIIDEAKKQEVPLIFINREPLETDMNRWEQLYYIGARAEDSAILQAEMISELFGNPNDLSIQDKNDDGIIQLVILKGEQGHQDAEIRTDVVVDELEKYGYELEIISIEICDWQRDIAYDKITGLLTNLEIDIELVISNNDAMALGAIDALVDHDLFIDIDENGVIDHEIDTWIPVIGIDGIADVKTYIDQGYLYGTVINDSQTMSLILIELIDAIMNQKDLDTLSFDIEDGKYIWVDYKRYDNES